MVTRIHICLQRPFEVCSRRVRYARCATGAQQCVRKTVGAWLVTKRANMRTDALPYGR